MKITRIQLKQLIKEELGRTLNEIPTWRKMDAARRGLPHPGSHPGPRPDPGAGIQIVYDDFNNHYDQSSYDFTINGESMSTRVMNSTDINDISYELSNLIGIAMNTATIGKSGMVWTSEEAEDESDKMALDFLSKNDQFLADINTARQQQSEYPGY